MKFKIPFTFSNIENLKRRIKNKKYFISHKKYSLLQKQLDNCDIDITREEYLAICYSSFVKMFLFILIISGIFLFIFKIDKFYLYSTIIALFFSGFILFSRLVYPRVFSNRKEKEIEKNLISGLEDMLVQLNSGVPLFSIMVNISSSNYGALSEEFKKAVKKINAGLPQIDVLEELGENNSSIYLKRTLWQLSNGMRAGSDLSVVIEDSIRSLNEEQIIQIQNYGNKLNPLIMFYMLVTIIIPALSITFLTIIASMVNLSSSATILLFVGLFVFVTIVQIMFLGVIKSVRPSLL